MKKAVAKLSSSQIILLGFFAVIVVGALLLWLPVSSGDGQGVSFTTALFTATTATCVTGLVVVPTCSFSFFGQAVILVLIQIGGLGVVTIMSGAMLALQKNISFGNRILLQEAFNLNSLAGIVQFVKKVFAGTALVEAVGAAAYMLVLVPRFGLRGVWMSLFNAVSAFCNAGMDIIGPNSLCDYVTHPWMNFVTMSLIILGGLGYIVWWDFLQTAKLRMTTKRRFWQNLTLHSKIVITTTLLLLVGGALSFFVFEYHNEATIGNLRLWEKLLASLFQSVTTRTAGFATLPQENFTTASSVLSMVLMIIGGSPVGTAGGIKTVTFTVLLLSTLSVVKGNKEVSVFNRRIRKEIVNKCSAIAFIFLTIVLVSTVLLSLTMDKSLLDIAYEIVSATGTVGLSRNLTASLNTVGRYVVLCTMYFGRIGPISMAVSFNLHSQNENIIKNPTEDISVG